MPDRFSDRRVEPPIPKPIPVVLDELEVRTAVREFDIRKGNAQLLLAPESLAQETRSLLVWNRFRIDEADNGYWRENCAREDTLLGVWGIKGKCQAVEQVRVVRAEPLSRDRGKGSPGQPKG